MADFLRLPMSSQTRNRFEHLLDKALSLGIDPTTVAAAGPVAFRALLALTQAKESESGEQRERYLTKAQDALRVLEHRKHPELVQQIQKAAIALRGRGRDSEVAHVTRGEIVVPLELQSDGVLAALRQAAEPYGVPLDMLRVGTALNHINPETGAPEFGVIDWISGLFNNADDKTSAAPPSNHKNPDFTFSPPITDPVIAAEEAQAIKEHLQKFPPEAHPILGVIGRLAAPVDRLLNKDEPPRPLYPMGGVRH
jgi:hypothetical protein